MPVARGNFGFKLTGGRAQKNQRKLEAKRTSNISPNQSIASQGHLQKYQVNAPSKTNNNSPAIDQDTSRQVVILSSIVFYFE